jgi:hypothetical protein
MQRCPRVTLRIIWRNFLRVIWHNRPLFRGMFRENGLTYPLSPVRKVRKVHVSYEIWISD